MSVQRTLKRHILRPLRKTLNKLGVKYNFLTAHYVYIISMTLLGSLLIYSDRNIAYIDALFFAGGACTQAGLNTVDVNLLTTWQQTAIFGLACLCNIVIINTAVVVVRLYWFQRRFEHIVLASRELVRSRSIARSFTEPRPESRFNDAPDEERAVNGKKIRVLLSSGKPMNATRAMPVRDIPIDTLKEGKEEVAAEEAAADALKEKGGEQSAEGSSSSRERGNQNEITDSEPSSAEVNQIDFENADGEETSRAASPMPERPGRDIRFGALPIPRKHEQQNSDILPFENAVDDAEEDALGRRTNTLENNQNEVHRNRFVQRRTSMKLLHPATFERILSNTFRRRRREESITSRRSTQSNMTLPYFTFQPTIGRNSLFLGLTEEQRDELGGIEYRAIKLLLWILLIYFYGLLFLSWLCLGPWITRSDYYGQIVESDGVSRSWWAIFTGSSMFNDLGYTLTPDSMISFQQTVWPLLIGSFFIIAGNTGFPCLLRLIVWIMFKLHRKDTPRKETLAFLLDHPRRCFTLLFPSSATWWLFGVLLLLNVLDLFFFLVLDLGDSYVSAIPIGYRILDGWFQAVSTRTAGFSVTNLQLLHPAILVSYMVMMYISIYPIAISIRRTNVYEEKSLGIYAHEDEENASFVATHIRRQLGYDLWYIFLGLFIICIVESNQIQDVTNYWFNIYNILFEVVSAYGTVGLSIGYPTVNASFSSQFHTLSKLVMVALMIRGRHRGLPYALDKAIMLPRQPKPDTQRRVRRRMSVASSAGLDRGRHED